MGGRFIVIREIGGGATAQVFWVEDTKWEDGKRVALKVLRANLVKSHDIVRRFEREAVQLRRVEHPGFIKVLDFGKDKGRPWISMEVAEGGSLFDRIERKPLTPRQTVRVVREVLEALEHAHERGVIHRDLKPQNILFAADGRIKIIDLGIAKSNSRGLRGLETVQGLVMGTECFMPPEQALDTRSVDERADIYGAGVVLYSSVMAFAPVKLFASAEHSEIWEGFPPELKPLVMRATCKNPDERFPTARAMIMALDEVYSSLPLLQDDDLPLVLPDGWEEVKKPVGGNKKRTVDAGGQERGPEFEVLSGDRNAPTMVPDYEGSEVEEVGDRAEDDSFADTYGDDEDFSEESVESGVTFLGDDLPPPRRRPPLRTLIVLAIAIVLVLISFVGIRWLGHSDESSEEPIAVSTETEASPPEVQAPTPEPVSAEPIVEVAPEELVVAPEPKPKPEMVRAEVAPPPKVEERTIAPTPEVVEPNPVPAVEVPSVVSGHSVITALKPGQFFSPVVRGQHKEVKVHLLLNGKWTISNMTVGEDGVWRVTITIPEGVVSFRYFITAVPAWSSGSYPNPRLVEIK
ncbi:MAG: protein kinase [Candidatus Uhrbacteria bacterium]